MLRRWLVVLTVVAALVALVGYAVRVLLDSPRSTIAAQCSFGAYTLDTDQVATASTMVGVVITRGLPERAAVLVLAAAMQESKLTNLASGDGDRDSVGVLQQRPSQGWGTVAELSDLHYATGAFLDALLKHSDWQSEPLATAIQAVQISADGSAYAPHEPEAQALADALTGATPAALSCQFPTPTTVASSSRVAAAISADLPINAPTTAGRSVTVPGASWPTAAWFVAHADQLGIESVDYDQRQWTRTKGWRADPKASGAAVVATLHAAG